MLLVSPAAVLILLIRLDRVLHYLAERFSLVPQSWRFSVRFGNNTLPVTCGGAKRLRVGWWLGRTPIKFRIEPNQGVARH